MVSLGSWKGALGSSPDHDFLSFKNMKFQHARNPLKSRRMVTLIILNKYTTRSRKENHWWFNRSIDSIINSELFVRKQFWYLLYFPSYRYEYYVDNNIKNRARVCFRKYQNHQHYSILTNRNVKTGCNSYMKWWKF